MKVGLQSNEKCTNVQSFFNICFLKNVHVDDVINQMIVTFYVSTSFISAHISSLYHTIIFDCKYSNEALIVKFELY